jgi:hypothetical protein
MSTRVGTNIYTIYVHTNIDIQYTARGPWPPPPLFLDAYRQQKKTTLRQSATACAKFITFSL